MTKTLNGLIIEETKAAVIAGAGAKGFSYLAILEAYEKSGFMPKMFSCVSAGSIIGALIAAGYDSKELKKIIYKREDFEKFFAPHKLAWYYKVAKFITKYTKIGKLSLFLRIIRKYDSVYSNVEVMAWVKELLYNKFDKDITFQEMFKETGIFLNIGAMDFSQMEYHMFNYRSSPNLTVYSAVVASLSIPFVFPKMKLNAEYGIMKKHMLSTRDFYDGGITSNCPAWSVQNPVHPNIIGEIEATDFDIFQCDDTTLVEGFIDEKEEESQLEKTIIALINKLTPLPDLGRKIFGCYVAALSSDRILTFLEDKVNKRVCNIPAKGKGISLTKFDMDNDIKDKYLTASRKVVDKYFEDRGYF